MDRNRASERMTSAGASVAHQRRGLAWVIVPFAVVLLALLFSWGTGIVILALAVGSVAAFAVIPRLIGDSAGGLLGTSLMGANRGTGGDTFSHEESLVMRGRPAEAAALFDERIAAEPDFVALRLRAAELHAREMNDPRRAAELFRQVQSHPEATAADEIHASNRLADLYLGPLQEPRRALTELRRITVKHPGSRAAAHAQEALRTIRAELGETPE